MTSVLFTTLLCSKEAFAVSDDEVASVDSYFGKGSFAVSATRYLKPLSEIAENITIITEQDMIDMNAHTVAEALERAPGLEMEMRNIFGNYSSLRIQGSELRQVRVIIDGITLNYLNTGIYGIGDIPVQHILGIEIIKGPASSAWGSSLGGVINIITKSGWGMGEASGNLYSSYGEGDTGDFRADIAGELGNLEYYLYTGKLQSEGLYPHTAHRQEHLYTKLKYNITSQLSLGFTAGYNNLRSDVARFDDFGIIVDRNYRPVFSTLSFNYSFDNNTSITLEARFLKQNSIDNAKDINTYAVLTNFDNRDKTYGTVLKLIKHNDWHTMLLGGEYDRVKNRSNIAVYDTKKQARWAIFANDTIKFKKLTITPGVRYEDTGQYEGIWAPSLGITWSLKKELLLRLSAARGFNNPTFTQTYETTFLGISNPDLEPEKVWSYQAGMETRIFDFVWLKLTLFRHDVRDAIQQIKDSQNITQFVNSDKQRRQGAEIEMRTIPVWNTSLQAAFSCVDADNRSTNEGIPEAGGYTVDLGLKYKDRSLTGLLTGHYIWWDDTLSFYDGKYDDMIFDISVKRNVYRDEDDERKVEIFLKGHNIFNSSQYLRTFYKNFRWVEMGVRYSF